MRLLLLLPVLLLSAPLSSQEALDPAAAEFFEKRVRPLLVERCFKCHSAQSEKLKGGLRLDSREAALKGGDSGPALVPGNPGKSLLVEAISYKNVDLQMPPKGKLTDSQAALLSDWIARGAPWPKGDASAEAPKKEPFDLAKRK